MVAGQVRWCGCWRQLLPTAGQGRLSELMAPGPDPGLGGDPEEGGSFSVDFGGISALREGGVAVGNWDGAL